MIWDGQPTDAKFKIQGGSIAGSYMAGSFLDQDGAVGQVGPVKVYADGNADNAPNGGWTPGAGTETTNFFAPNQGAIQAADAGFYATPQ
jgi:hypothetical protein